VFNGQAIFYVVRERRRLWSSRPSLIVVLCSMADMLIIPTLAAKGIFMRALPLQVIIGVFGSAIVLAFVLDALKAIIFRSLRMV